MNLLDRKGFTISEFLITSLSLFSGLYFIFWTGFLGSNCALAQTYLNDYAYCDLGANTKKCWATMKRQIESLRFIESKKLFIDNSDSPKTVKLIFDYQLPIIGANTGVHGIQLTSVLEREKWQ